MAGERCEECGGILATLTEVQCGLCDKCGCKLADEIDGPPWVNQEELEWDWGPMVDDGSTRTSMDEVRALHEGRDV